jgi:hypothetical protein
MYESERMVNGCPLSDFDGKFRNNAFWSSKNESACGDIKSESREKSKFEKCLKHTFFKNSQKYFRNPIPG